VYKIFKGFDDIKPENFFELTTTNLRGHSYKLFKKRVRTNIGKYSFASRVVDVWNHLSAEEVSCNAVTCFKVKVDQIFKNDWGLI